MYCTAFDRAIIRLKTPALVCIELQNKATIAEWSCFKEEAWRPWIKQGNCHTVNTIITIEKITAVDFSFFCFHASVSSIVLGIRFSLYRQPWRSSRQKANEMIWLRISYAKQVLDVAFGRKLTCAGFPGVVMYGRVGTDRQKRGSLCNRDYC